MIQSARGGRRWSAVLPYRSRPARWLGAAAVVAVLLTGCASGKLPSTPLPVTPPPATATPAAAVTPAVAASPVSTPAVAASPVSTLAIAASPAGSPAVGPCHSSGILAEAPSPAPGTIAVTLVDFKLTPARIEATAGTDTFMVTNQGPTPHNFTIRDATGTIVCGTDNLRTGQSESLSVALPAAGSFVTFCSLPGHESLGVVGSLSVTDGPPGASAAPSGSPSP